MKKTIALLAICAATSGCGEFFLTREVTGKVKVKPENRIARTVDSIQQKIALRLEEVSADSTVMEIAGGPNGTADLECLSTRCSTLQVGDCIALYCLNDRRLFESNVIQCKLNKVISCK